MEQHARPRRTRSRDATVRYGTAWSWRSALDWVIVAVGLVLLWWGIIGMASPTVSCRGAVMAPGDVCHKSSYTSVRTGTVQTYDQRRRAVAQSRPTVIVLGGVTFAFGLGMTVSRSRARQKRAGAATGPRSA
ncbi:hypothetical protein JS278_02105 [Acidipropionibacterium virtanenii]|uniref:Transmembrane protein n=1 Tax=Acidipropionibacterium virtanenii TaxID=2057246 RepID=A0A344UVF9_9ACTN|nr:hypothetical protein JS278_02105 [Acidipropionibacterium virtanenii]